MHVIERIFPFSGNDSTNSRLHADYPPSTSMPQIIRWRLGKVSTWVDISIKGLALGLLLSLVMSFHQNKQASRANTATLERLVEAHETIRTQNQRSIDDRAHLNTELENTRKSLQRLERAVKTGEYP